MTLKILLYSLIFIVVLAQKPNPIVKTKAGILRGAWKQSTKNRTYASFEGVPYAMPPVGEYRFKEPQEREPWVGVWDATRQQPRCIQYDPTEDAILGSENCLHINVYTPKLKPKHPMPVMYFIHGGVYMYGAGNLYLPDHLMDKKIVIVTVNYRMGPFGFLSTSDAVIPGNFGLKDQSCALHWIQKNIRLFGGDPDRVLLTGCSAGSASVNYHYLSPMSRGTFKRGIAFSGASFASWVYAYKPIEKAKELAYRVGCPTDTSTNILSCLRTRPADTIVQAQVDMFDWKIKYFGIFTPTIESPDVECPFLTEYPYDAAQRGAMQNSPLIASVTTEEGLYPAAAYYEEPGTLADLEANWTRLASNIFEYGDILPENMRTEVAAKIKQRYLNNEPVSDETYPQLVQALGDRLFVADVGRLAEIHARSGCPTYSYRFGYRSAFSFSFLMAKNTNDYGVSHADDVCTIFKYATDLPPPTQQDIAMREQLLNMVYNFAAYGEASLGAGTPEWLPVEAGSDDINFLEISAPDDLEMKSLSTSDFGKRSFWDSLGFIENEKFDFQIEDETLD